MKIVYVLEHYYPHVGGVEVFFQHLAEGVAAQGHDVFVITSKEKETKKFELLSGVQVHRIALPRFARRYWFTLLSFFATFRAVRKCDIVHTTTYNAALPAWVASFMLRKKSIITIHEVWGRMWFKIGHMNIIVATLHFLFEKLIISLPFSVKITDSEFSKKSLGQKSQVIYPGIDYDFFQKNSGHFSGKLKQQLGLEGKYVYLYFGRPGWAKGVEYLINAFAIIQKKFTHTRLLLLLSKEPRTKYNSLIKKIDSLGLLNFVTVKDSVPRNQLPGFIREMDCCVVPSISEGFGFSAAEASAVGVPIVCTNAGSLPEVASGKVVFSEPLNSPALAKAMTAMYENHFQAIPEKKFFWSETVNQYIHCYESLAKRIS